MIIIRMFKWVNDIGYKFSVYVNVYKTSKRYTFIHNSEYFKNNIFINLDNDRYGW